MSISYRVIGRKMTVGENQGRTMYYGRPVRSKFITYKQLCRQIMIQSSATRGDVSLILENFMDTLQEYLKLGHSVQMGDAGIFSITAGSQGAEQEEDFTAHMMKPARVNFRPSVDLRDTIARVKFEKENPQVKMVVIDEPCPLPHD